MKTGIVRFLSVVAAGILLAGCDDDTGKPSASDRAVFNQAAPEMKQVWDKAIAADKANDYLAANTNFVSLLKREITPEQLLAVQSALASLNARMNKAAAKGDAAALKAMDYLKNLQGTRRPPNLK
jgi:hypothetical protein